MTTHKEAKQTTQTKQQNLGRYNYTHKTDKPKQNRQHIHINDNMKIITNGLGGYLKYLFWDHLDKIYTK